ncbi:hypothetical protein TcCL_ESM10764 [Trypanosoma cruzi]|nr:hypothetical protein TcCL_ESM10764 [Trypanosoma cruzi]
MILRSAVELAYRRTEVSFADARWPSDVALPGCGGEWGPDTAQSPRHRGAKHTVDAADQKGLHGVLGRTGSCAQPRPMAEWCGLLLFLCEEFCCFLNFGTGRWCIGVF